MMRRTDATQRQVDEARSPGTTCSIGNMELGAGQALAWRGFAQRSTVRSVLDGPLGAQPLGTRLLGAR